ncbi:MAG: hypothetical protein ACUVXH_10385, partial [Anaerolineae bacterium]
MVKAKYLYILILILALVVTGVILVQERPQPGHISLRELASKVEEGQVTALTVEGDLLTGSLAQGGQVQALKEPGTTALETLRALGVSEERLRSLQWEVQPTQQSSPWGMVLAVLVPTLFVGALAFAMFQRSRRMGGDAFAFARARARRADPDKPAVTFDDVAGVDEAKEELR